MDAPITFKITHESGASNARAGVVHTKHGAFQTPAFCVVGTKGTVKGILPRDLKSLGVEVVLANTYHLFLQPGEEKVKAAGGLGNFMQWDGPTVTDSGGFQVFSLGEGFNKKVSKFGDTSGAEPLSRPVRQGGNGFENDSAPSVYDEHLATSHGKLAIVDEEGVTFTSHIDGSLHRFTPERSIEIQHALGADIFFAFDECTSPEASYEYQKEAADRTHRWAQRSIDAHRRSHDAQMNQAIFGIVQGGRYTDLRKWSAETIGAMPFDGFGIGGSFSKKDLGEALSSAIGPLPNEKPRHLLGIGEPEDIFEGVENGIDMFDCVLPTRLGRTGTLFTKHGKIDIRKALFANDLTPFTDIPAVWGLAPFSRGYVHHLFRAGEMLGPLVASMHNVAFIVGLIADVRKAVLNDSLQQLKQEFFKNYKV